MASLLATLCATSLVLPSRELSPKDVVRAQLDRLQADDVQGAYAFASPANRRNIGLWQNLELLVKRTPAYSPLVGSSSYELLSALSLGERWTCRVRVQPCEEWRRCLDRDASPAVGGHVRLTSEVEHLQRALDSVDYSWSELMRPMAGESLEVLCDSRPNRGTNIVGLPSPDGSQGGVWYFPVTALQRPEGARGDETAHEFRWELAKQPDTAARFGLGQVILHRKFSYRGVIVGYDATCEQSEEWCEQMGVDKLPGGRAQPFYHVLVDKRDHPGEQITYVAEENVVRPPTDGPFAIEAIDHSYVAKMLLPGSFDGAKGTYEPCEELRGLYPPQVHGCRMVDAVTPDGGSAVDDEEGAAGELGVDTEGM